MRAFLGHDYECKLMLNNELCKDVNSLATKTFMSHTHHLFRLEYLLFPKFMVVCHGMQVEERSVIRSYERKEFGRDLSAAVFIKTDVNQFRHTCLYRSKTMKINFATLSPCKLKPWSIFTFTFNVIINSHANNN